MNQKNFSISEIHWSHIFNEFLMSVTPRREENAVFLETGSNSVMLFSIALCPSFPLKTSLIWFHFKVKEHIEFHWNVWHILWVFVAHDRIYRSIQSSHSRPLFLAPPYGCHRWLATERRCEVVPNCLFLQPIGAWSFYQVDPKVVKKNLFQNCDRGSVSVYINS